MRLHVRYTVVCLFVTSFCSVFWFTREPKGHVSDSLFQIVVFPLPANDRAARTVSANRVERIEPWEAAQLIRELGFDTEINFDGFNNETGTEEFIVPNVIHYIRFKQARFSFVEYICMLSAYFQQQPDYIFIHTDVVPGFRGKYWQWILRDGDLASRIRLVPIVAPLEVFGQKLSASWRLLHGSDLARIRTMMTYGGIYLDTDVYVVRNLDKYRKYELALGWPNGTAMGTQVMIGHKNARFPPLWLDTYREYRADDWYYNAGERPTSEVLERQPGIVHRVTHNFGVQDLHYLLYLSDDCDWPDWRKMDTVHLLANHRWYLDPYFEHYRSFNERNVAHYPFTFGEMARLVMAQVAWRDPATAKAPPHRRICRPRT